ncbi:MAG: hypothetical protein IKQ13_10700 [Treponema sp.]|nr:hypothetical protein [Treponema sp.]
MIQIMGLSIVKKFLCSILAGLLFLSGCSLIDSSNDDGGITLRLPENSGRSVTSEGSLVAEGVSYYVVRLRKDGEVEQEEKVSPGSTITIDGLYPGEYTVAILGVDSDGIVQVYGRSPAVEVKPGETSSAAVRLEFVSEMTLRMLLYFFDSAGEDALFDSDNSTFVITASEGGTSHSYTANNSVDSGFATFWIFHAENFDTCVPRTVKNFLEPGISYKFSVKASDIGWDKTYSGSSKYVIENGENVVRVDLR